MAELVDALGSGSSVRRHMGVQVPPSAPPGIQAVMQIDCGFFFLGRSGTKEISLGKDPKGLSGTVLLGMVSESRSQEGYLPAM